MLGKSENWKLKSTKAKGNNDIDYNDIDFSDYNIIIIIFIEIY
jgi:hypothetical protein